MMPVFVVALLWRTEWLEYQCVAFSAAGAVIEAASLVRRDKDVDAIWSDIHEVHVARIPIDNAPAGESHAAAA